MKHFLLTATLAAAFTTTTAAADLPKVRASQVLKIAEDWLRSQGVADRVYVTSVALRDSGGLVTGLRKVWVAKWSSSIPARTEGKRETGIEVTTDGEVSHLIEAGDPELTP